MHCLTANYTPDDMPPYQDLLPGCPTPATVEIDVEGLIGPKGSKRKTRRDSRVSQVQWDQREFLGSMVPWDLQESRVTKDEMVQ
ncbi:hypothetical protein JZ751_020092, partial [Albula glossodonta]